MCVKICDCNNCKTKKSCVDCIHMPSESEVPAVSCHTTGVQNCPFRVKFDNQICGGADGQAAVCKR